MIYVAIVDLPDVPAYTVHQYLYGFFPQHPPDGHRPFLFRRSGNRVLLVSRIPPACPHRVVTLEAGRSYPAEGLLVPIQRRRITHPQHRKTVLDQRDVDGELPVFLDELLGAIERINQPVA